MKTWYINGVKTTKYRRFRFAEIHSGHWLAFYNDYDIAADSKASIIQQINKYWRKHQ